MRSYLFREKDISRDWMIKRAQEELSDEISNSTSEFITNFIRLEKLFYIDPLFEKTTQDVDQTLQKYYSKLNSFT